MNNLNPTPIQIGLSGSFSGRTYRVVGRVVMGTEIDGETWKWNEFNLAGAEEEVATLVHEQTESGEQWRFFTPIEPAEPLRATDLTDLRVGDLVTLENRPQPITGTGSTTVYFIEGQAPEGVQEGDTARYFNAGSGSEMWVASWTEDEVELFKGINLPRGAVAGAFDLATESLARPGASSGSGSGPGSGLRSGSGLPGSGGIEELSTPTWPAKLIAGFVAVVCALALYLFLRPTHPRGFLPHPPAEARPLPPATLSVGDTLPWQGFQWRVQAHRVIRQGYPGGKFRSMDLHEFELRAGNESSALLRFGRVLSPDRNEWVLLLPFEPPQPLLPSRAATRQLGHPLAWGSAEGSGPVKVTQLLLNEVEGDPAATRYGFVARSDREIFLARWNEEGITVHRAQVVPEKEIQEAQKQRKMP